MANEVTEPLAAAPDGVDAEAWAAACRAVREYCQWHVAPSVTQTLTLDGPGGSLLMLPSLRVTDVAEVTNDGTALADPEWSASGMIRARRWSSRFRGVSVTLTHGYDECPEDILAVLEHMARNKTALETFGPAQTQSAGAFSMQMPTATLAGAVGLSGQHRGILDKYRLPPRP